MRETRLGSKAWPSSTWALCAVGLFGGCAPAPGAPDASTEVADSGVDAGRADVDAGAGVDAGAEVDAGRAELDAGARADSGVAVEADAGLRGYLLVGSPNGLIQVFTFDSADGGLVPTSVVDGGGGFLAADLVRGRVYAVNENAAQIAAFAFDPVDAGLRRLNAISSGGAGPTFVGVDPSGPFVWVANYGGGTVAVLAVANDGGLERVVQVDPACQQAHQVVLRGPWAYAPCKALDVVLHFDTTADAGPLTRRSTYLTDAGAGPRHLALHPTLERAYLVNELASTVETLAIDASGRLERLQLLSSLPSTHDGGLNTGAEIAVHPNGRFVFVSNRGHDSIARFSVDPSSGLLALVGHTASGGATPRHFSIDATGRWLIVANQNANRLQLFSVNPADGALTPAGGQAVTAPTYAGFVSD